MRHEMLCKKMSVVHHGRPASLSPRLRGIKTPNYFEGLGNAVARDAYRTLFPVGTQARDVKLLQRLSS